MPSTRRADLIEVTVIQTGTEKKDMSLPIKFRSMPGRRGIGTGIGHRVRESNLQHTLDKLHKRHSSFHTLEVNIDDNPRRSPQPLHLQLDSHVLCKSKVSHVRLTTSTYRMLANSSTFCGVPIWEWNSEGPNSRSQCTCQKGHKLKIRGFQRPTRPHHRARTRREQPAVAVPPVDHATEMHATLQTAGPLPLQVPPADPAMEVHATYQDVLERNTDPSPHWGSSESLQEFPSNILPAAPDPPIPKQPLSAPPRDVPYNEQPIFCTRAHVRGNDGDSDDWDDFTQPSLYEGFQNSLQATQLDGSTVASAATPPISPRPVLSTLFPWVWSSTAPTVVSADDADNDTASRYEASPSLAVGCEEW